MPTGIQTPQNILSTFTPFGPAILSTYSPQKQASLASARSSVQESVNPVPYPESAAQWLLSLLDLLAGIVNWNEDLNRVVVTETEYQQLSAVLDDLIYGVGENENHPLSAAMTLVGILIKTYEDEHFPKLTDLFPELAEDMPVEAASKSTDSVATISGQIDTDFVIVFFSIGCLLWKGGKTEKAISAYDLAIRINPDYASVHASRGEAKSGLNDLIGARMDLQNALKLAKKHGEEDFSVVIDERLQELDVVEAAVAYFSEPRFAKFSILRECRIQMGTVNSRADIVLRDAEGNFVTIVECKLLRGSDSGDYGHEPLKSFLCATDALFGIFASSTSKDSWIFYQNLRHNRFQKIERYDFEKQVVK